MNTIPSTPSTPPKAQEDAAVEHAAAAADSASETDETVAAEAAEAADGRLIVDVIGDWRRESEKQFIDAVCKSQEEWAEKFVERLTDKSNWTDGRYFETEGGFGEEDIYGGPRDCWRIASMYCDDPPMLTTRIVVEMYAVRELFVRSEDEESSEEDSEEPKTPTNRKKKKNIIELRAEIQREVIKPVKEYDFIDNYRNEKYLKLISNFRDKVEKQTGFYTLRSRGKIRYGTASHKLTIYTDVRKN